MGKVTAAQVLAVARSQIGTKEGYNNDSKYGRWYGLNHEPWCAMFVTWVFSQVGGVDLIYGKFAYCPNGRDRFASHSRLTHTPKAGDLVFYNWSGGSLPEHVGIVEAVLPDGRIQTIEGNTSSGIYGSQSNGGGVWRRIRSTSSVVGYGVPEYATAAIVAPPTNTTVASDLAALKKEAKTKTGLDIHKADKVIVIGTSIRALQRLLKITVDGQAGAKTKAALGAFQKAHHLTEDFVVGPKTLAALLGKK